MGKSTTAQTLSYPLRLPDEIQADALRLLDVSREVINLTVTALWDRLDEFATRTTSHAYKQVEEMIAPPLTHGHRQWRCEAEQAGRILRSQAERKQQFDLILPLLLQGMIQPKTDTKRAGKNRKAIKQALVDLREANSDGGNTVELQSLIEQACNFYLQNGCFPETYEEMQPIPVLKAGILPYAGDDGPAMGQTYHMSYDLDQKRLTLAFSSPNHRQQINEWGAWLCCSNLVCLWNGSRDYAASINIACLGAALIRHAQKTSRVKHPQITDPSVQPVSYIGTRAALRLPPLSLRGHLMHSGRIYCNGWTLSAKLRSSYATPIMLRLCS